MSGQTMGAHAAGAFTRSGRGGRAHLRPSAALERWLMLLVALTGLMAMHGLSDHGVGEVGFDGDVPRSSLEPVNVVAHADAGDGGDSSTDGGLTAQPHHGIDANAARPMPSTMGVDHCAGKDGDGHGDMLVGLCLAVLTALLLFAPLSRCFHAGGLLLPRLVDVAGASATAVRARARGPACPDLKVLSIQRC